MELYRKYRPTTLKRVIGQKEAVDALQEFMRRKEVPHFLMFTGPSGCGKTSLARIMTNQMGCVGGDLREINAAMSRGIDDAREIARQSNAAPMGKSRVWIIDEAHKLTDDAQNSMLKELEDPRDWSYFMACTTNPTKLIKTVRNRAYEVKVRALNNQEMSELIEYVLKKEGNKEIHEDAKDLIIELANGSPRAALVMLDKIIELPLKEQLKGIERLDTLVQAKDLFGALLKGRFADCCKVLKDIDEDPEGLRRYVLAAATNIMVASKGTNKKAYKIANAFRDPFYDTGKPGLILACLESYD